MRDLVQVIKEFIEYAAKNKKWWLLPVILALVLFGLFISTTANSSVPVFIYPMV